MIQITFADLLIDGAMRWRSRYPTASEPERFPRRHGAIAQRKAFIHERVISISGEAEGATESALDQYLDNLGQRFAERGLSKLRFKDDARYINAILASYETHIVAERAPVFYRGYEIEFLCPDPFWYADTADQSGTVVPDAETYLFNLGNGGGMDTPPRIAVTAVGGPKTDIKLGNTSVDLFWRYTGTIPEDGTLFVDHDDLTMKRGGVNALPDLAEGSSFWPLITGTNQIRYDGPTGVSIEVEWTKRWAS